MDTIMTDLFKFLSFKTNVNNMGLSIRQYTIDDGVFSSFCLIRNFNSIRITRCDKQLYSMIIDNEQVLTMSPTSFDYDSSTFTIYCNDKKIFLEKEVLI